MLVLWTKVAVVLEGLGFKSVFLDRLQGFYGGEFVGDMPFLAMLQDSPQPIRTRLYQAGELLR